MRSNRLAFLALLTALPLFAQHGATNGEWRFYGGDGGTTKYSALDQINASHVKNLKIAWEWKSNNFGKRPETNWEVTPLMPGSVLYFTAGTRRDAVAVDSVTGETLWVYRLDEGTRGNVVAREVNRGLAYWSDSKDDLRIILISPGYQLVCLNATRFDRSEFTSFSNDGNNLWVAPAGGGGNMFRALDKETGETIHEMALPAMVTGVPMTYMANGKQYIVVAVGAQGVPAELAALALL
jgi:glucose dehydrogenase